MISTLVFLVELLVSIVVFIWIAALFGFADDAHRNTKANFYGKFLVIAGIFTAALPFIATLYAGWQYYFLGTFYTVPLGWWFPVLVAVVSYILGIEGAKQYKASYRKRK